MFKHIVGQAILQLTLILILFFGGQDFLPEYKDELDDIFNDRIKNNATLLNNVTLQLQEVWKIKYNLEYYPQKLIVRNGKLKNFGKGLDYEPYVFDYGASRHMTYIFNMMVMMTLFNFLNARKIRDEINIFAGIFVNPMFCSMVFMILFLQAILLTWGGSPFHCYKWIGKEKGQGLTIEGWLITIGFGMLVLIWGVVLKSIPDKWFCQTGNKAADPIHDTSRVLAMKRNNDERSLSRRFSGMPRVSSSLGKVNRPQPN